MSSLPPKGKPLPPSPPSPSVASSATPSVAPLELAISRVGSPVRQSACGAMRAAVGSALAQMGSVVEATFAKKARKNMSQEGSAPTGAPPLQLGLAESSDEEGLEADEEEDPNAAAAAAPEPNVGVDPNDLAPLDGLVAEDIINRDADDMEGARAAAAMVVAEGGTAAADPEPAVAFDGAEQARWVDDENTPMRVPVNDLQFNNALPVNEQDFRFEGYEMRSVLLRERLRDMSSKGIREDDVRREAKEINRLLYQLVLDHRKAEIMDVRLLQYDLVPGHGPEAFDCAAFYLQQEEGKWYFGYYMHTALGMAQAEAEDEDDEDALYQAIATKAAQYAFDYLRGRISRIAADVPNQELDALFADRAAYIPSSSRENQWKPEAALDEEMVGPDVVFLQPPYEGTQYWENVVADHVTRPNMGQTGDPLNGNTTEWAKRALRNMFELMLNMTRDEHRMPRVLHELDDEYSAEDHAETQSLDRAIKALHSKAFVLAHYRRLAKAKARELGVDDDALVYGQDVADSGASAEQWYATHRVELFSKMWNVVWAQLETLIAKRNFQFAAAAERRAVQELRAAVDDQGEPLGTSQAYYQDDELFRAFMATTGNWLSGWVNGNTAPTLAAYGGAAGGGDGAPPSGAVPAPAPPPPRQGGDRGAGPSSAGGGALTVAPPAAGAADDALPGYDPTYKKKVWIEFHSAEDMRPCTPGHEDSEQPYREWNTSLIMPPPYVPSKTEQDAETARENDATYLNMLVNELENFGFKGETVAEYNVRAMARSALIQGGDGPEGGGPPEPLGMWTAREYVVADDALRLNVTARKPFARIEGAAQGHGYNGAFLAEEAAGGAYLPGTAFAVEYCNEREGIVRKALCVLLSGATTADKVNELDELQKELNAMGPFGREYNTDGSRKDADNQNHSAKYRETDGLKHAEKYYWGGKGLDVLRRLQDSRNEDGTYPAVLPKAGTAPLDTHTFLSWYFNETFRWWRDVAQMPNEKIAFFDLGQTETKKRWVSWMRFNLRLMAGLPLEVDYDASTCRWVRNTACQANAARETTITKRKEADCYSFKHYLDHRFNAVQSGMKSFFHVWKLVNRPDAINRSPTTNHDPWGSVAADDRARARLAPGTARGGADDPGRLNNPDVAERYQVGWRIPFFFAPKCNDEYRMHRPYVSPSSGTKLAVVNNGVLTYTTAYNTYESTEPLYHNIEAIVAGSSHAFRTTSGFKILDLLQHRDATLYDLSLIHI